MIDPNRAPPGDCLETNPGILMSMAVLRHRGLWRKRPRDVVGEVYVYGSSNTAEGTLRFLGGSGLVSCHTPSLRSPT